MTTTRTQRWFTAGILLSVLACVGVSSCAGTRAREEVLLPILAAVWPAVSADVDSGVALLPVADREVPRLEMKTMMLGLVSRDIDEVLAVNWPMLLDLGLRGIKEREISFEIGPGVADSFRERLRMFSEAWHKLREVE
jgi:hypothetical protein